MKDLRSSSERARETAAGEAASRAEPEAPPVRLRMTVTPRVPRVRSVRWRSLPSIRVLPLPEDLSK